MYGFIVIAIFSWEKNQCRSAPFSFRTRRNRRRQRGSHQKAWQTDRTEFDAENAGSHHARWHERLEPGRAAVQCSCFTRQSSILKLSNLAVWVV
nr:hypothetical protein Itr_chr04CG22800 [Ipomoea trifida]